MKLRGLFNLRFLVQSMFPVKRAILAQFKLGLSILAVFLGCIILALALAALHSD